MVHKPVEIVAGGKTLNDATWDECFQSFLDLGGHEDRLHTVGTGKRIYDAIRTQDPQLDDCVAEPEIIFQLSRLSSYSSRPDLVGSRGGRRFTVDFKYTEKAWRGKDPWPVRDLLPYDDQLLGQAIASKADGFMRARADVRLSPTSSASASASVAYTAPASKSPAWVTR